MYLLHNGYKQFNQPRAIFSELCLLLDLVHLMKILHTEQEAFNLSSMHQWQPAMTTSTLDPLLVLGDTSGNRWIFSLTQSWGLARYFILTRIIYIFIHLFRRGTRPLLFCILSLFYGPCFCFLTLKSFFLDQGHSTYLIIRTSLMYSVYGFEQLWAEWSSW